MMRLKIGRGPHHIVIGGGEGWCNGPGFWECYILARYRPDARPGENAYDFSACLSFHWPFWCTAHDCTLHKRHLMSRYWTGRNIERFDLRWPIWFLVWNRQPVE